MKKSVYLSSLLALCCTLFAVGARAQAPVVTTNPVSASVCNPDTAWFHVAVTGATPITFQWEYSTDGGTSWDTTLDGATYLGTFNDTLRVIGTTAMNGTQYRLLAFNTSGSDTSDVATLTVDNPAGPISSPAAICETHTVTLTNPVAGGTWTSLHPSIATIGSATGILTGVDFGWDTVVYTVMNVCGTSSVTASIRVDSAMMFAPITGPSHVCVGNMITLANANVIGTRTWSTGVTGNASISSSGVVTGLMGGLDTVMYTITNACNTASATYPITIDTLLGAGTITGPTVVCAGSWIHLTASASGGVWISSNTAVAVVSGGNVTGIGMGTSVISYYQSNSCGASAATLTVTVDIPAAPISGNDSVGIDSNLTLTNIVPGGMWASSDVTIATVGTGSGIVHGLDTGVTTIIYTVTNACGTTSASMAVNVGPLPDAGTLSGPDTVCVGATITLTPSITGGTWVSRHDTIATVSGSGVVTGVEVGKDTVDYYVTTAFGRSRVVKPIYVNEPPMVTINAPASVALGGYYTLTVTPTGGSFVSSNPGMAPLIGYGFFVVLDTGTTIFTYTKTNGCGTRSAKDTIHIAGASEVRSVGLGISAMSVFPNPTQGALTVSIASAINEEVIMTLSNVTGQKVGEYTISTNKDEPVIINQPAGVYMLSTVTKDGNRHTARVTVTR